jgi:CO/xanthine dehydrogenase FAD-binding subunit
MKEKRYFMKPAPFEYYVPTSIEEACQLLNDNSEDGKLLAGGQSLVPMLALRLAQPSVLIDLNGITELDYLSVDDDVLTIGALMRHHRVESSPVVREHLPLLASAIRWIGHPQIRNRGTIGGSLAHADPAAELPAIAMLLDATFIAVNA